MGDDALGELSAHQAWAFLQQQPRAVLIDIRSSMEFLFVGHPTGAVHIAWIDEPEWDINPEFVDRVRNLVASRSSGAESGRVPIVLICRSGKRSQEAAKALLGAGIENVYHVDEGFEGELDEDHHRSSIGGWRFHGLPWEQC